MAYALINDKTPRLNSLVQRIVHDAQGGLLPLFAILLFAVIAVIGATLSLSMDNSSATNLQHSADSSALGGAIAFLQSDSPRAQDRTQEAKAQAMRLAQQNANYDLTRLDLGTVTEDVYGQHFTMEVELQFKPVNAAASLTGRNANIDIKRRAVASATWGFPLCILALETSEAGFFTQDNASLSAGDCIIWSNSDSQHSTHVKAGKVSANYLCAHGNIRRGPSGVIRGKTTKDCDKLPDPMKGWSPPKAGNCMAATAFHPPQSFEGNIKDAPEFDKQNSEFYGAPSRMLKTELDVPGSPTTVFYWGGKLLKQYKDINRKSLRDNCHAHKKETRFHCHRKDNQFGLVDHRDFNATRYVPEAGQQTYSTPREAHIAGDRGITQFHDLAERDNLEDWEYARDTNFRPVTDTLLPGTYCGIDIAWGHIRMEPGIYFIKGAPLQVTRRAKLTAEGVTLIFTDPGAYLRVSDEAEFTISAPVTGDTAGIAIAEARNTRDPKLGKMVSRLSGKGAAAIIGLIYLPGQDFFLSGAGTGDQASPLLQMIVNRVAMRGDSKLNIEFEPSATSVPVVLKPERAARLVE